MVIKFLPYLTNPKLKFSIYKIKRQVKKKKRMTFLRSIATTTTAIAVTALPASYVASSLSHSSSSSSSSSSSPFSKFLDFHFLSPRSSLSSCAGNKLGLLKNLSSPPSAVQMENPKSSSYVRFSLYRSICMCIF